MSPLQEISEAKENEMILQPTSSTNEDHKSVTFLDHSCAFGDIISTQRSEEFDTFYPIRNVLNL